MRPPDHKLTESQRLVYYWADTGHDMPTLAAMLGLCLSEVSRAEHGHIQHLIKSAQVWLKLAEVMRVPLADLVTFVATGTMTESLEERIVK